MITGICNNYLKRKPNSISELDDVELMADQIVKQRASVAAVSGLTNDKNLINLNDTLMNTEDEPDYKQALENMQLEKRDLEAQLRLKEESLSLLTAKNNSLEDDNINLNARISELSKIRMQDEERIKTYCLTISEMNGELSRNKDSVDIVNKLKHDLLQASKLAEEKQKELKAALSSLKRKEIAEKDIQLTLNQKNKQIIDLENENTRLKLKYEQAKDYSIIVQSKKVTEDISPDNESRSPRLVKCAFENVGNCKDKHNCKYFHPKEVCQSFSKLGSCITSESMCEHRHPKWICKRLVNTGFCQYGDRCRDRHPIELTNRSIFVRQIYLRQYRNSFLGQGQDSSEMARQLQAALPQQATQSSLQQQVSQPIMQQPQIIQPPLLQQNTQPPLQQQQIIPLLQQQTTQAPLQIAAMTGVLPTQLSQGFPDQFRQPQQPNRGWRMPSW